MNAAAKIAGALMLSVVAASLLPGPYAGARGAHGGPVLEGSELEEHARSIILRACGSCHSNGTVWPWYSGLAPASWMIRRDVANGRKFLNFSDWGQYGAEGQRQLLLAAAAETERHAMPPGRYSVLHADARLSAAERSILIPALHREANRLEEAKR